MPNQKKPFASSSQDVEFMQTDGLGLDLPAGMMGLCFHSRPACGPTVRLLAVGDVALSGGVPRSAAARGWDSLLSEISPLLQSADITFANLEAPFVENWKAGMRYAAPVEGARALKDAGFTLLHLANTHILDYGPAGLDSTLVALKAAGLRSLGAGSSSGAARQLVRTDCRGLRIGWLGCGRTAFAQRVSEPSFWEFDETEILAAALEARPSVDVLVVSLHLGFMYVDHPHPDHKALAEKLVQNGTDLVLIHHPHVLQGVEVIGGKLVCFSLGNFLFEHGQGNVVADVAVGEQKTGGVFLFDLDREGVSRALVLPTVCSDDLSVRWATGPAGRRILDRLVRITRELGIGSAKLFHSQHAERNTRVLLKVFLYHLSRGHLGYFVHILRRIRPYHALMLLRWIRHRFVRALTRS